MGRRLWRSSSAVLWFLVFWAVLLVVTMIAVDSANTRANVLIFMVPGLLGTLGLSCAIEQEGRIWPKVIVAMSLVLLTPGFFLNLMPCPMLALLLASPPDIPGLSRMPIRTTVGIVLILLIGAVAAWGLAGLADGMARRVGRWQRKWMKWVAVFPLWVMVLLTYFLVSPLILLSVYLFGLYSEIGGFF